jgi:hypothetical protein
MSTYTKSLDKEIRSTRNTERTRKAEKAYKVDKVHEEPESDVYVYVYIHTSLMLYEEPRVWGGQWVAPLAFINACHAGPEQWFGVRASARARLLEETLYLGYWDGWMGYVHLEWGQWM